MFILQFRDAPSDAPLREVTSPLPLPVPGKGDRVELYGDSSADGVVVGRVSSIMWGYQPSAGAAHEPSMDILARVWLDKVSD